MDQTGVAYAAVVGLVRTNPASKKLYVAALEAMKASEGEMDRKSLAASLDGVPVPATCTQTSQQIISSLASNGALEEMIYVDGERYEGTLDELREDETIPEDAVVEHRVAVTEAGLMALEHFAPSREIALLFEEKPQHSHAFKKVLKACSCPEGKSGKEVETLFKGDDEALKPSERTGLPTVYPAFFTGELERVGAVEWNGAWRTTEEGRAFLTACE